MKSVFKMVINFLDYLFIIDMFWVVCYKRFYWKLLIYVVCVKWVWDFGVKVVVILIIIMLDDLKC